MIWFQAGPVCGRPEREALGCPGPGPRGPAHFPNYRGHLCQVKYTYWAFIRDWNPVDFVSGDQPASQNEREKK